MHIKQHCQFMHKANHLDGINRGGLFPVRLAGALLLADEAARSDGHFKECRPCWRPLEKSIFCVDLHNHGEGFHLTSSRHQPTRLRCCRMQSSGGLISKAGHPEWEAHIILSILNKRRLTKWFI